MQASSTTGDQGVAPRTLYIVGTPIGNLEDITFRALRVLKNATLIACEDTRHTQKLLNHFLVSKKLVSYHEHNEAARAEEIVAELEKGASVALVSDAGMPGISDPGYRVVSLAVERGIPVVPVPGPAAFVAALAASGLPTDSFLFSGFLPAKHGQRVSALEAIRDSETTTTFYEAPHRIVESLEDVVTVLGSARPVVVAREVTKLHEEFLRGTAAEVLDQLRARGEVKGEITLIIGKRTGEQAAPETARVTIRQRVREVMAADGIPEMDALKRVAKERGISKSEAYREWQRSK